jgi:hypothetical protein
MLEHIRKYTGLMFVVLILLFLGLVFFGDVSGGSLGSGPAIVEANGQGYSQQDYQRLAENPIRLLRDLSAQQANFQGMITISRFTNTLGLPADGSNFDPFRFLVNRVNLQSGARDYGLHASQADIESLVQSTVFANRQGEFDAARYSDYVKRNLPRLGMSVQDMNEILGEMIVLEKLSELLGSGLQGSKDAVRASVADRQQQLSYQIVSFPRGKFENSQAPTDEEIKTYWEEHQGRYQSDAERRITYVLATPDYEALAAEKAAESGSSPEPEAPAPEDEPAVDGTACQDGEPEVPGPDAEEADAPAEPSGPSPSEATPAPAAPAVTPAPETPPTRKEEPESAPEAPAPKALLTDEERAEAVKTLGMRMDGLWTEIYENDGQGFEKLAEQSGLEVKATELFTIDDAPAELKGSLLDDPGRRAVDAIFQRDRGTEPRDAVSDVRRVGDDQWLLFRIDEAIEPADLTFEEARDRARLDLVEERAVEAMVQAAEDAHEAVSKSLEAGKSFEEAVKEHNLTSIQRKDMTLTGNSAGEALHQEVFNLASKVNPGHLSEVLTETNDARGIYQSVFVYVEKRELVDSPAYQNMLEQGFRRAGDTLRQLALQNWFSQQYAAAGVRSPST